VVDVWRYSLLAIGCKNQFKVASPSVFRLEVFSFYQATRKGVFSKMDVTTPVERLKARLEQLRAEEVAATRALNDEQRASKYRRSSRSETGFTHLEENVALSLVVKQNTSFNMGVTYLTRMQDLSHHKFLEPRSQVDLHQVLSARFHALPLHIVHVLTHPVGEYWLKVSVAANKFINEFQLRAWIIEQNVVKGLAPPSSEVGATYDQVLTAAHAAPIIAVSRADMQSSKNRSWVYRYRGRWGISIGKINTRDIVAPEEIHEKVVFLRNIVGSALFPIFGTNLGFLRKCVFFN
jgi:hypothetical protein